MMRRTHRERLRRIQEATTDTRCCINYALAAGLGVCVPKKLKLSTEIVAALRNRGWRVVVMYPDDKIARMNREYGFATEGELYPPTLRTLGTFARHFKKGTFLIITSTGPVVLRNGELIDFADRGLNRRRVAGAYRLERR